MPDATPARDWISLALAVFFLVVGVRDLLAEPPNVEAASWELMFAAANALLYWAVKGGPRWARTAGYALFFGGVLAAIADFFL